MTEFTSAVAEQLAAELEGAVGPLAALAGVDAVVCWPTQLSSGAPLLAAQLCQGEDDHLAAQTVIDVMCALWPHGSPENVGRPDWWRTPLGRACARSLGADDAESVSQSVAAAILGVTRGTIAQLLHRGTLDRHPDGGVTRTSVLARADRLATRDT